MDTECSDAESSSSHGVSWWNLTTPCCVRGSRQWHDSRSHDLQSENVLLLVIFQTYGVSSHHDGHSYVCSMDLWFLLRTVCCNCCKRSLPIHSVLLFFKNFHTRHFLPECQFCTLCCHNEHFVRCV